MVASRGTGRSGQGVSRLAGGVGGAAGEGGGEEAQAVSIEAAIAIDRAVDDMGDLADDGLVDDSDPLAVGLVGGGHLVSDGGAAAELLDGGGEAGAIFPSTIGAIGLGLVQATEAVEGQGEGGDGPQAGPPWQQAVHCSPGVAGWRPERISSLRAELALDP